MLPFLVLLAAACPAEIRQNPGGKELPHDAYIHAVSEADSPVQQVYIKTKDGLYVAAAMRKPKGDGPFPALIHFHGAPGGRGMEQITGWVRGDTGGPVLERFLKERYVVVTADYRAVAGRRMLDPTPADQTTYIDDGLAVVDYVSKLPYVDSSRVHVYGVSLGGNLVLHLIGRTQVKSAILGAPAPMGFLGVTAKPDAPPADRFAGMTVNEEMARANIEAIRCPVLIFAGTADSLLKIDRELHDRMAKAGKPVRLEIYENGYHDFVMGPQGHKGRKEPLLDATLDALDKTVAFANTGGDVLLRSDIEYAPGLKLDAHVPEGAGPFPAVIIVHGGGWTNGNKQTYVKPLFEPLSRAGLAWFSIDYRLAPGARFPAQAEDVDRAIEWVRSHAGEYRVDPRRIAIMGESAGGHLVSYVGARNPRVAAVVSFYGVHDIAGREKSRGQLGDNIKRLLGVEDLSDASVRAMQNASPVSHVKRGMPPYLLIHGTGDKTVPYDQSVRMCEAMRAAGASCELFDVPGAPHGVEPWEREPKFQAYKEKMVAWLKEKLR